MREKEKEEREAQKEKEEREVQKEKEREGREERAAQRELKKLEMELEKARERKPSSVEEMETLAERYRVAHPNKPLAKPCVMENTFIASAYKANQKTGQYTQNFKHRGPAFAGQEPSFSGQRPQNYKTQSSCSGVPPVDSVLKLAHYVPVAGHMGVARTEERILQSFYWPNVQKDVKM
ncbi:hypothetical protein ElyMa_000168300 [Elysia marginata]|uniref:Integrase zinc-binding domain-containing protein n=1 Tax=Elysia marginata TaxID=1093978 RepID=A0AAV4EUA2_9GAST|nr:hypothetical protein ElyMa_000168300 [Elysia marginata]